jgi:hypothetical protein
MLAEAHSDEALPTLGVESQTDGQATRRIGNVG